MTRARGQAKEPAPGLVPVVGFPFPVLASPQVVPQAQEVAGRCARAYELLADALGPRPDVTVLVLAPEDWPTADLPYGMPHYSAGRLVLAGQSAGFWRSFVPLLEQAPPPLYAASVEVYGEDLDLGPFFNLLGVHELGHAFHDRSRFPRRWLDETFANLCLHAYMATTETEAIAVLEAFPEAITSLDPALFEHRSLQEFEALYSGMDPINYGWYQCHFHRAAKRVHDHGGIPALQRLWRRFVPSDEELAEVLRRDVDAELARTLLEWLS
ncbi:MAG TPA: hypothetical protein VK975_01415 [Acidimicrobiales bacterium]|nr:hypothetical protein [Acidimicrobiales bacterium]